MSRYLSLVAIGLFATAVAVAAPVPKVAPDPTKDRNGFPLPAGATARLGFAGLRTFRTTGLYFSPDSKTVSTADDRDIFIWDGSSGRPLPVQAVGAGTCNTFLAGDRTFALAPQPPAPGMGGYAGGEVVVRNRTTGAELTRIPYDDYINFAPYHGGTRTCSISVNARASRIAFMSKADKSVGVYDTATGKRLHRVPTTGDGFSVKLLLTPDDRLLYLCDQQGAVRRFDLVGGKELATLDGTDRHTVLLDASPDGKWVLSRGRRTVQTPDGKQQITVDDFVTVHDANANKIVGRLETGLGAWAVFAGTGAVIATTVDASLPGRQNMRLSRWDVETQKRVWDVAAPSAYQMAVSPDGRLIALLVRGQVIDLYDAVTGKRLSDAPGHSGAVAWIGFAPDGQTITTAGDAEAITWTLTGEAKATATPPELARGNMQSILIGDQLVWPAHDAGGKTASLVGWDRTKGAIGWRLPLNGPGAERLYSHDGKRAVGVWSDNKAKKVTVAAFDGPAGKKLGEWDVPGVTIQGAYSLPPLALSGDGTTLFVGDANGVTGYDAVTGKAVATVKTGALPVVALRAAHPLAVSPDGARLAVARADGRRQVLEVFEVKSGKRLASHEIGSMYYPGLRFSNNGRRVAAWTIHGTTLVFDAESDAQPRKLDAGKVQPLCAAFSPNDATLAVGYGDGTTLLWDLTAK